jgi:hypothetical protein
MAKLVRLLETRSKWAGNPVFSIVNDWKLKFKVYHVYTPSDCIDGHWLIRIADASGVINYDETHDRVIGVTSHINLIPQKTYEIARAFAMAEAERNHERFVDQTRYAQSQ